MQMVFAGVAGGLGQYFGVDPVIIRVALVVLVLTTSGLFFLLYLAAMFIVPKEPKRDKSLPSASEEDSKQVSRSSLGAAVLIGVGLLALSDQVGLNLDGDFLWPLAFIGFGVAVLWSRRSPAETPPFVRVGGTDPYDPTDEAHPFRTLVDSPIVQRAYDRVADTFKADAVVARTPTRLRSRSRFSTIATAGFFVAIGLSWLFWRLTSFEPSPRPALGGALTIIGGLLILGGWLGRPKLVSIGILLTLFLGITSAAGVRLNGGVGQSTMILNPAGVPLTSADPLQLSQDSSLTSDSHLDVGALTVDARKIGVGKAATGTKDNPIVADVGIGMLTIAIPPEVDMVIDAKVGGGELNVDGRALVAGVDQASARKVAATKPPKERKARTLYVDGRVGLGVIRVVHLPASARLDEIDKYMGENSSSFNVSIGND
jgi:phage shock protein PspC (stress-responsive transcriptional regulator)